MGWGSGKTEAMQEHQHLLEVEGLGQHADEHAVGQSSILQAQAARG